MNAELNVLLLDDAVGIETPDGVCVLTPTVAVEIAQSLILAAKDADPSLDVQTVMDDYKANFGGYRGDEPCSKH